MPGRTYNLVISVRYGDVVGWFDDVQLPMANFNPPAHSRWYFVVGAGLDGYIDEAGVYNQLILPRQNMNFDSLLACKTTCPAGKTCYLSATGPMCA